MFVLPKGTLVKVGGMPFRLLEDVPTDGLETNYRLAMESLSIRVGAGTAEHSAVCASTLPAEECYCRDMTITASS